jgi:glycosyltransferase involved in cell wall biosynthesis
MLTIITVNLNNSFGLERTIKSVLSQETLNFEFIVVDGKSSDESLSIIKDNVSQIDFRDETSDKTICNWTGKFGQIPGMFFYQEDKGVYHAMNKGILVAKGDYLLFLNSGDVLVENDLISEFYHTHEDYDFILGKTIISKNFTYLLTLDPPQHITLNFLINKSLSHQSTFIKRKLFDVVGLFSDNLKIHADLDFFLKSIIINNASYKIIKKVISDYNLDGLSSSENMKSISFQERNEILNSLFPKAVLVDYHYWQTFKEEISHLLWLKDKPFINNFIKGVYKLATMVILKFRN